MNGRTWFPVSSGLLTPEHIPNIGPALAVFLWFIHRQYKPKDGEANTGLVNGGGPVTCNRVGTDLGIPPETCRKHIATLEAGGYIRAELIPGLGKRYYISNPIRWTLGVTKNGDTIEKGVTKNGEGVSPNLTGGVTKFGEANKEQLTKEHKEQTITSKPSVFDLERNQIVLSVWDHYITVIRKNPKLYTLTDKRKRMGVARVRDLWPRAVEPKRESVTELMKLCVDRLASSPFHNGKNQQGKKYLDWEILFRSTEQMEKWLSDEEERQ